MKFREHRGALSDSMATLVELPNREALVDHLVKVHSVFPNHGFDFTKIRCELYIDKPDERIGWRRTYIILLPGYGPLGFSDEEPADDADEQYMNMDTFGLTEVQRRLATKAMHELLALHEHRSGADDGMGLTFALAECLCVCLETGTERKYVSAVQAALIKNAIGRAIDKGLQ